MEFHQKRRQRFMGERHYAEQLAMWDEVIEGQRANLLKPEEADRGWHCNLMQGIADGMFIKLCLHYTAGEPIEPLRTELESVIVAFEEYGSFMWKYTNDRNEPVFNLHSIDEYCQLMQLIGLCFLLHRRDLLARLAALQDGTDGANGGADNLYEEFMSHGLGAETRYESDWISETKPYQALSDALFTEKNDDALKHLERFLKHWYKDLAGTGWHDSHKPNETGDQGGYCGYWSFEAGAAVLLLGIEDDSSLHQYLYYPKDLVAWAREHASLSDTTTPSAAEGMRLRAEAGQPTPREGFWFTPARAGSRRFFKAGEAMPSVGGDYGATIWQWDQNQEPPKL